MRRKRMDSVKRAKVHELALIRPFPVIVLVRGACVSGDREAKHCESAGFRPGTQEFDDCYRDELIARRCEIAGYEPGSDDCYYWWKRIQPSEAPWCARNIFATRWWRTLTACPTR